MAFLLLLLSLIGSGVSCAQTETRGVEVRRELDDFRQEPRVAVVVAVDQYPEESGFRRLAFAAKDADALAQALTAPDFNYKVRLIVNQQAVRTVIRGALKNAAAMVNGKGTLLFFFAGHGGQKGDKQYLATYETGADNLEEFGLPLSEVKALMAAANAPRKILIVDACRNDPTAAASRSAGDTVKRFSRLEESKGLRILNATGPEQVSYEDPKLAHGVFTYFLLKGLHGEAADPYGLVTFRGLADFVSREVRDFSYPAGHLQMPYEAGDAFGDFLLGGTLKDRPEESARGAGGDSALAQRVQKLFEDALLRFYVGEASRAAAQLESVIQLDPSNVRAAGYRALLAALDQPGQDALDAARAVLKQQSDNMPALFARGVLYSLAEHPELSGPDLDRVRQWQPADVHGYFLRGLASAFAGHDDAAIADYREVIRLKPAWGFVWWYQRGRVDVTAKRYDDAVRDFTESIKLNSGFEYAFFSRGTVHAMRRQYAAADRDLGEAVRLNPDFQQAVEARQWVRNHNSSELPAVVESKTVKIPVTHVHDGGSGQTCFGNLQVIEDRLHYDADRTVDGLWDDLVIPMAGIEEVKVNAQPAGAFHVKAGGKTYTFLPRAMKAEQAVAAIQAARK